jgi:hypothetical protein
MPLTPQLQAEADRWLAVMRSHARTPHLKRAAAPGEDDVPFEQAFANLGYTYLKSRAPALLDHELGFQVLKKTEDNQKAVGIFGFDLNGQLIYAPVFFLNGELKGRELLYAKDSDTFFPSQENWVNELLGRKPPKVGDRLPRGEAARMASRPDLSPFRDSPTKWSADLSDWAGAGVPGLAHAGLHRPEAAEPAALRLVKESCDAALALMKIVQRQPKTAAAIEAVFPGLVKAALDSARTIGTLAPNRPPRPARRAVKRGSIFKEAAPAVTVHRYAGGPVPGLTPAELVDLRRDGMLIKDARDEASVAYTVRERLVLSGPTCSGVYDILGPGGDTEKVFVAYHPFGPGGRAKGYVSVRLEGKDYADSEVAVAGCDEEKFKDWFEGLPKASGVGRGHYLFVGKDGETVGPVRVEGDRPAVGGGKAFACHFSHCCDRPQSRDLSYSPLLVVGAVGGDVPMYRAGAVYVPESFKAVELGDRKDFAPVSAVDLEAGLMSKTAGLELGVVGGRISIGGGAPLTENDAVAELVVTHGLREKAARDAVFLTRDRRKVEFRVKYAEGFPYAPYPDLEEAYGTDPLMGSGYPVQMGEGPQRIPVPGLESQPPGPMEIEPSPYAARDIQEAASTGQREVLDATLLQHMLKSTRDDSLIDRYLGPLMRSLDAVGRLLFNFYWNGEKFSDRYGEEELPELEDSLRTTFESMGDLVLYLKQRHIDPFGAAGDRTGLESVAEV